MTRKAGELEAHGASSGAVLELLTGVPADVFGGLPPAAQAAVVARVVPDRVRTLDLASAEAVISVVQRAANTRHATQDLALAACVRREELDLADLEGEWADGSDYRRGRCRRGNADAGAAASPVRASGRGSRPGGGRAPRRPGVA